ncbi:hypothetical protein NM208_g13959 [Fusarium decemcellulare]|uniref:Uncharacterized protein n=1 Tax=Fusarium decemcellulare TaxID=57161 RepID=A0ACC1RKG9_9HYPO|nr:hypothetical protein NM208_g13959 [Fusarium decemcellulare]
MSQPTDLAWSGQGWPYNHGKQSRVKRRIIRIRKDIERRDIKTASTTMDTADTTNAGKEWSEKETNLDVFPRIPSDELALVLGEIIPRDGKEILETTRPNVPNSINEFQPGVHPVVPQQDGVLVVVRLISHNKCNLFVLRDKQDGLCCAHPLPSIKKATGMKGRIVFYEEWAEGVVATEFEQRDQT